jgi:hypothetical protein
MENEARYESMTPEAADTEIKAILDDKDHRYHAKVGTPGRTEAVSHMSKLFAAKSGELHPAPLEANESHQPEFTEALEAGINASAAKQVKRVIQARKNAESLTKEFNFGPTVVSEKITGWQADSIEMQLMNERGDDRLHARIQTELLALSAPNDVRESFAVADNADRRAATIEWIYVERKRRANPPTRKSTATKGPSRRILQQGSFQA